MWTTLIILSTILVAFSIYVKVSAFIGYSKYRKKYAHIFEAHKAIAYPSLSNQQQFDILDNYNTKHISSLTQYGFVPTGLLDYYLDIEPGKYISHLKSLNLKEKLKFDAENLSDGFFINQISSGFEYLFVERQQIEFRKRFSNYDKLLKYIAYDKLNIYAPGKYKQAWFKKILCLM